MKTALILVISWAIMSTAAGPEPQASKPSAPELKGPQVKRLGSVTWDPRTHLLRWTVQNGATVNGEFVASGEERYEISPDDATMGVADKARGFSDQEAVSLHRLLDALSIYCAESVVWWDQGQGTPIDPNAKPARRSPLHPERQQQQQRKSNPNPVRVGQPEKEKTPQYRVPQDHIVAMRRAG